MGIIYTPPEPDHICQPGTHINGRGERVDTQIAVVGTAWQCDEDDCDRIWVAHDAPSNHATVGQRTVGLIEWRRETRRELRRRRKVERARGSDR
jgi:hypothetical protein